MKLHHKTLPLIAILLVAGTVTAVLKHKEMSVQAASIRPFGGTIIETQVCECTANFWLRVSAPTPAAVVYQPGVSKLYDYGQIFNTGANALGTYAPGGTCKYNPPTCRDKDVNGTIITVGTSR